MVVFTCNNCGDSVNKPKVDKHIQYECKRKHFAVSFCCVDCLKDFNSETVRDHCQCVTEEERYSAKGFVPKASAEKGKRKQAGWVEIVQSVIDRKDLSNDEKQFLNIISKFDNVPRKKNKFQNFCFSSAPAYRKKEYLVDKVFDMIECEYKEQKSQNLNQSTVDDNNTETLEKNDNNEGECENVKKSKSIKNEKKIPNESTNNEIEETPKKKKKSKKSLDILNNELEGKSEEIVKTKLEKKTKKNKEVQENGTHFEENVEINTNSVEVQSEYIKKSEKKNKKSVVEECNDVNGDSISKKKKKNKNNLINGKNEIETNGKNEIETNGTIEIKINGENETHMSKKEKKEMKKKMKYQYELASISSNIETDKDTISKKKRKLIDGDGNVEPQQKILKTEDLSQVLEVQSGRKFEWNEAILQVLQCKKSKPMSISKIMKRVINEFHSLNEITKKTENELEKIFLKKLRKMKNVVIDNDKAKLVEC